MSSTGEAKLFKKIRESREHVCAICGKRITEPITRCFAHILPKGKFPKLRLCIFNILLVCSRECHHEVDKLKKGQEYELEQYLLSLIKKHDSTMHR